MNTFLAGTAADTFAAISAYTSIAAVLVSAITVVFTYFMNKKNLEQASLMALTTNKLELRKDSWRQFISECDNFLLIINVEHFKSLLNDIVLSKNNKISNDNIIININKGIALFQSSLYKLKISYHLLNADNKQFDEKVEKVAKDATDFYQSLQKFYLNKDASKNEFEQLTKMCEAFKLQHNELAPYLREEIFNCEEKIFETKEK